MLRTIECVYLCYGEETAPSTGTPHLQGYVVFKSQKRLSGVNKLFQAHWDVAKGTTEQNYLYCSKDGKFIEYGTKPKSPAAVGSAKHEKWLDVIRSAKEGTAEEEYPGEFIRYHSTLLKLYEPDLKILDSYSGLWYCGPPGTGKSKTARAMYPDLYDKLLNKWWDGYKDEETVLIDDIDTTHTNMGLFLKRYADHYPFRAEYKGGSKMIRPKTIIVTSNYTIDEIFLDSEMAAAIHRRYKTTHFRTLNKNL